MTERSVLSDFDPGLRALERTEAPTLCVDAHVLTTHNNFHESHTCDSPSALVSSLFDRTRRRN